MPGTFRRKGNCSAPDRKVSWDRRLKISNFAATLIFTASILIGGLAGIYTYNERAKHEIALREEELRLRKYNSVRDVYFELITAVVAVGAATSRDEAKEKFAKFTTLYYGKAHIYALDNLVHREKDTFYEGVRPLLETEDFPSEKIAVMGYQLTKQCKRSLAALDVTEQFSLPTSR